MATIVLTAVGGLIGGPIGAAVGAIAGQRIDSSLFAPKARQGPRLGDLAVQTSSYGTAVPKIFGTMRVAGTVIWATDLKERKQRSGGGKGRPKTVNYTYSASFAVALSGRPIRAVRRIWADGKLLRGAAGDFKTETGYRLYLGTEDQPVDPLIASAEGVGNAPAHRGIAYALFKDFQLADYGNRIPSLTFEVEADAGPVPIGSIAQELSERRISSGTTPSLIGYAAGGDSVRGAIEALADVAPMSLIDGEGGLILTRAAPPPVAIAREETGARGAGRAGGATEFSRKALSAIAAEVSIAYHDQARDYQLGLQRARRGPVGGIAERVALPAVLTSDGAKAFAEDRLAQIWTERKGASVSLAATRSGLRPGAIVRLLGRQGLWRVARWNLEAMVVSLELVKVPEWGGAAPADPGRAVGELDQPHGPTELFLLELPALEDDWPARPHAVAVAAGASTGWRRAALLLSFDGGGSWDREAVTAGAGTVGHVSEAPAAAGAALFDERSAVEVELLNASMWLEGRSDEALAAGANLAAVGSELIQFGRVEPLGGRRFRLSRLLRGRRGTEWAAEAHVGGEPFVLIERDTALPLDAPAIGPGAEIQATAQGIGDGDDPPVKSIMLEGRALQPPSPVHLRAERALAGDVAVSWVRRSRLGWTWGAGDTPLGEEAERYRLEISSASSRREVDTSEPRFIYTAEQQSADGASGRMRFEVSQAGTHAASRAATLDVD